ncbi:MAG: hypothetical protein KKC66_03925 [Candidatus Omnitrophica bacterium]|nr:hypothetical protein [Candidatus Omnitrophota bacterium]MBU1933031.1 hypothetical protein [Candidatus Omnitrophota bacterium]
MILRRERIKEIASESWSVSWPAGLLQILWQLGAIALFYILSILPAHNIETMAAFTNGLKIESLIFLPAFAFNMANAVLIRYIYISLLAEPIMAWGVILGGRHEKPYGYNRLRYMGGKSTFELCLCHIAGFRRCQRMVGHEFFHGRTKRAHNQALF